MESTRRSFIGGIIASVTAGQALVKLANPEEVRALSVGKPASLLPHATDTPIDRHLMGHAIFMQRGDKFEPVGVVTSFQISRDTIDATLRDGSSYMVPGLMRASGTFEMYGTHMVDVLMGHR